MKHLKTYENLNELQVGDYVVSSDNWIPKFNELQVGDYVVSSDIWIPKFIENTPGQIVNIKEYDNNIKLISVKYKNIPNNIKNNFTDDDIRSFFLKDIQFFSKNEKDVKDYIELRKNTNKYNI